jgi:predicted Fe-S protein YdhL (DUF1289 family)
MQISLRQKAGRVIFSDETERGVMLTSPCTGLCRIENDGFCRGCGRTRDEIGAWSGAGAPFRRRVWAQLPQRRAALGIKFYRKDWSAEVLGEFIVDSLRRGGVWTSANFGADFRLGDGEIGGNGGAIRCVSSRGAIAFDLDESVCAFATGESDDETIILATPRRAAWAKPATVLSRLGPDRRAVREQDRAKMLYDLGFGRIGCTICARTNEKALDALVGREGRGLVPTLEKFSPHWVVLSPIGRIEIFSRDAVPAEGVGIEISPAYVACAFHRSPR